ncbi:MAG TPA: hypothetical protein VMZ66_13775 [Aeromicrobium sp.]|nr:hypothetical protein [Aeromicrobium sp.]
MAAPKLPGDLTWPKLLGTSIAAVVAAWLGGHLGLGGTLSGIAIGSLIATFSTSFFTTTIDKTHQVIPTVLVRTDRGTVIETGADHDVAVENAGDTTILPAQSEPEVPPSVTSDHKAPSRWSQIHWKSVAIASLLTIGVTLVAISLYESAVGRTWGSNEPGTTIGNTVHGGHPVFVPSPTATPTPTDEPSESPTPSGEPSESPTPTTSATPTPTATPSDCPTATASPSDQPSPGASSSACPTPTTSPSEGTGLLR